MEEDGLQEPYRLPTANSRDGRDRWRPEPEGDRFWRRVDRTGDCWLWTGAPNASGYGTFRRRHAPGQRQMLLAHRLAYELLVGPIPAGLTLDHLCGVPLCVRPDHLEPVTASENLRRRHARRRATIGATS